MWLCDKNAKIRDTRGVFDFEWQKSWSFKRLIKALRTKGMKNSYSKFCTGKLLIVESRSIALLKYWIHDLSLFEKIESFQFVIMWKNSSTRIFVKCAINLLNNLDKSDNAEKPTKVTSFDQNGPKRHKIQLELRFNRRCHTETTMFIKSFSYFRTDSLILCVFIC